MDYLEFCEHENEYNNFELLEVNPEIIKSTFADFEENLGYSIKEFWGCE